MDTYYRLLRAEVYSSIQKGIHNLKSDSLDDRDMYTYQSVCLAGYCVQKSSVCLALKFKTKRKVTNWAASRQLMFGNLVTKLSKFFALVIDFLAVFMPLKMISKM